MKIGILTLHKTHNYGGCLQAVATRLLLEQNRHEAYYVDYWPSSQRDVYSIFNSNILRKLTWKGKCIYILDYIFCFKKKQNRKNIFEAFLKKFILPYCKPEEEKFDIILYGSDQIWRKNSQYGYNPVYFASNNFVAKKHVAFSASMGNLPSSSLDINNLQHLLKNFSNIAVREESLLLLVKCLGFQEAIQTIDPTLLIESKEWDNYFRINDEPVEEKYILYYPLRGGFSDRDVKKYAKSKGLKLKTIRGAINLKSIGSHTIEADPVDFIKLIKNAEMVLTSSFHGLAFSIIYKKEFFVSFDDNGKRAESLLGLLKINNRYLRPYSTIPSVIDPISYEDVSKLLNSQKKIAIDYLNSIISSVCQ